MNRFNLKNHIIKFCIFGIISVLALILMINFQTNLILLFSVQIAKIFKITIIAGLVLTSVYGLCIVVLWCFRKMQTEKQIKIKTDELQSDPLKSLVKEIREYIRDNKSTTFFKEKLETILTQLPQITEQVENVKKVAAQRFGNGTISYTNNIQAIESLYSNLIKLGGNLIQKLQMFDENKYQSKISELKSVNKYVDVSEYEEVLQHYVNFTNDIITAFEKTSIKMDKLILEFAKLKDEDLQHSIDSLKALDNVIVNIKLYK